MMHAYLRLKGTLVVFVINLQSDINTSIFSEHQSLNLFFVGYRNLSPEVEEGICQVLGHLWLESEITSGSGSNVATSSAASSSSSSPAPPSSKKGAKTDFEKKLGEFFKHQIETDSSVAYGDGFRAGMRAVELYGLRSTLDHIKLAGSFPF
jgi:hypothetical protein